MICSTVTKPWNKPPDWRLQGRFANERRHTWNSHTKKKEKPELLCLQSLTCICLQLWILLFPLSSLLRKHWSMLMKVGSKQRFSWGFYRVLRGGRNVLRNIIYQITNLFLKLPICALNILISLPKFGTSLEKCLPSDLGIVHQIIDPFLLLNTTLTSLGQRRRRIAARYVIEGNRQIVWGNSCSSFIGQTATQTISSPAQSDPRPAPKRLQGLMYLPTST